MISLGRFGRAHKVGARISRRDGCEQRSSRGNGTPRAHCTGSPEAAFNVTSTAALLPIYAAQGCPRSVKSGSFRRLPTPSGLDGSGVCGNQCRGLLRAKMGQVKWALHAALLLFALLITATTVWLSQGDMWTAPQLTKFNDGNGWKADISANNTTSMSDTHSKIIATAAKAELASLAFRQKGRSRLWLADLGWWLNVVEFTPSRWSKSVSLMNAAHWLWVGSGFMSFDQAVPSECHAAFETEQQFRIEAAEIAKVARAKALEMKTKFSSFDAAANFVIEQATRSPDRMGRSWWGYEAGVASGLIEKWEDAERFLRWVTDERVTRHVEPFLALIGRPEAFKKLVNDVVATQRARLKLAPLVCAPFLCLQWVKAGPAACLRARTEAVILLWDISAHWTVPPGSEPVAEILLKPAFCSREDVPSYPEGLALPQPAVVHTVTSWM